MYALEFKKECVYLGVEYTVVDVLDNDLLLVVNKTDMENGKYPLQTFIVPDEEVKRMRS